jgi:uncharacterized protein
MEDEGMGTALSYPGVYIEELSSGQHTVTGVATSIAAFIGWAPQGPVDRPEMVQSFAEYQTIFGGYNAHSYLGYAVSQFFANGGSQAYIIRLVANTDTGGSATEAATATVTVGGFTLYASSPGAWPKGTLTVAVTAPSASGGFSLTVSQTIAGNTKLLESYSNLSVVPTSSQYVVAVINADSNYITFINPANPGVISAPAAPTKDSQTMGSGADGDVLDPADTKGAFTNTLTGPVGGYQLLEKIEIFNLMCVPGYSDATGIGTLQQYCSTRRAFLIVDSPKTTTLTTLKNNQYHPISSSGGTFSASHASNSAYYFPWVTVPDPLFGGRPKPCPPCGSVAGIYAATDSSRGVWKAPAGVDASLSGVLGVETNLSDLQNGQLNPHAVNCLRLFSTYGNVVWGARTMDGDDLSGSQWKYVPVRRLALFLESSLYYGTQWAVFEPNDETLWGQLRMNVGTFMQRLFLDGAFAGASAQQAYFVKCDAENNPASSTALGVVNIAVGFAPLYPAEFVVIQIQQISNQS